MKRSLSFRYFYLCASIILCSVSILGVLQVSVSSGYFRDENYKALEKKASQDRKSVV